MHLYKIRFLSAASFYHLVLCLPNGENNFLNFASRQLDKVSLQLLNKALQFNHEFPKLFFIKISLKKKLDNEEANVTGNS